MTFDPKWRYASTQSCSNIGKTVLATVNGYTDYFHIVDCSGPNDVARHRREGLILEVDYQSHLDFFPANGRTIAKIWSYSK